MSDPQSPPPTFRHYFVDEAGDPNLFKRRGKTIVGQEGCSNFFVLGLADVADPVTVADELNALRKSLLADPYFKDVPSFDPARRKTAIAFHAKDDLPEVPARYSNFCCNTKFGSTPSSATSASLSKRSSNTRS